MNLRSGIQNRRASADANAFNAGRFAVPANWASVPRAMRVLFASPFNHTPSLDGQQACPSALLPVDFSAITLMSCNSRERFCVPVVDALNDIIKGFSSWQFTKSVSHSHSQQVLRPVATTLVSKRWAAVPLAQVQRRLQAVALFKAQRSARAQTSSHVIPTSLTATNATTKLSITAILRWPSACGVFRMSYLNYLPHKGPVYVQ